MSEGDAVELRERIVRLETLVEGLVTASARTGEHVAELFESVRRMEGAMERDHAVQKAEREAALASAARDRRVVKFVGGLLTLLWIVAQAVVLFGGG
jgi:hypothetical protein